MLRSQPAIMQVLGDDFRKWAHELSLLLRSELQQLGRTDPELDTLIDCFPKIGF